MTRSSSSSSSSSSSLSVVISSACIVCMTAMAILNASKGVSAFDTATACKNAREDGGALSKEPRGRIQASARDALGKPYCQWRILVPKEAKGIRIQFSRFQLQTWLRSQAEFLHIYKSDTTDRIEPEFKDAFTPIEADSASNSDDAIVANPRSITILANAVYIRFGGIDDTAMYSLNYSSVSDDYTHGFKQYLERDFVATYEAIGVSSDEGPSSEDVEVGAEKIKTDADTSSETSTASPASIALVLIGIGVTGGVVVFIAAITGQAQMAAAESQANPQQQRRRIESVGSSVPDFPAKHQRDVHHNAEYSIRMIDHEHVNRYPGTTNFIFGSDFMTSPPKTMMTMAAIPSKV